MSETKPGATQRKLIIVGDGACGKTSLLAVFATGTFPEVYTPVVLEPVLAPIALPSQRKSQGKQTTPLKSQGKQTTQEVELLLTDTPGQEDYDRRPMRYEGCHVALVCFSVDWPYSLENVEEKWINEVRHYCPHIPILLVGLKKDLRDKFLVDEELREIGQTTVSFDEAQNIAEKIGAKAYLECSAKTGEGVREVFERAAEEALRCKDTRRAGKWRWGKGRCVIL